MLERAMRTALKGTFDTSTTDRHRKRLLAALLKAEYASRAGSASGHSSAKLGTLCESACARLFPDDFRAISRWHAAEQRSGELALQEARAALETTLPYALSGRAATVEHRLKSPRSIFEKATLRGKRVDDLCALRVIVDDRGGAAPNTPSAEAESQCHTVRTLCSSIWPDAVLSEKDYISAPKPNSYQSIHLELQLPPTPVAPKGRRLEVQIRSRSMDERAARGAAAHATYKASLLSKFAP